MATAFGNGSWQAGLYRYLNAVSSEDKALDTMLSGTMCCHDEALDTKNCQLALASCHVHTLTSGIGSAELPSVPVSMTHTSARHICQVTEENTMLNAHHPCSSNKCMCCAQRAL